MNKYKLQKNTSMSHGVYRIANRNFISVELLSFNINFIKRPL